MRQLPHSVTRTRLLESNKPGALTRQSHKSYRPLTILTFRLSYILAGERWSEVQLHSVNVFLHAVVSVLVLPVCRTVFGPDRPSAAFFAALFFATHPIHTDAVSSIVSRGEMLSGIMLMLSFLAYVQSTKVQGVLSCIVSLIFWCPLAVGFAFVGMLCKEQAITVVGLHVAFDLTCASPIFFWIGEFFLTSSSDVSLKGRDGTEAEQMDQEEEHQAPQKATSDAEKNGCQASHSKRYSRFEYWRLLMLLLRMAGTIAAFGAMYWWRMSLNGECITVYKTKGDPLISAWDAAGTVAPGVYSHSACKPNFLQVENPARFVTGDNAFMVKSLTWNYLLAVNAKLLCFPTVLKADYSHDTIPIIYNTSDPRNAATIIFWISLVGMILYFLYLTTSRWKDPSYLLSLAFLVGPFIPSSNLVFPVGFVVAERVLYMPSLGFCMLLGLALQDVEIFLARKGSRICSLEPANLIRICVATIAVLYSIRTWVRNYDWLTREHFYGAMIRDNPTNPKAHYGYGNIILNDVKRIHIGEKHMLEASKLQPNYFDAYNDLGAFYNRNQKFEKAEEMFNHAVTAKPEHINGLTNQGLNYLQMRKFEEAFMVFDQAVDFFPDSVDFYHNMGQALQGLGPDMHEDALAAYHDIINLDPFNPRSYYLFGIVAGQQGKQEMAEVYFRNALRINPRHLESLYNLGVCLVNQQRHAEAWPYFVRVHAYHPSYSAIGYYINMLQENL